MKTNKNLIIVLICVIVVLTISAVVAGNSAYKEIKNLNIQIDAKADSLNQISNEYNELTKNYEQLELKLEGSKNNLNHLKDKVDSVLSLSNQSLTKLRSNIDKVLENQEEFEKVTSDDNDFRFQSNNN